MKREALRKRRRGRGPEERENEGYEEEWGWKANLYRPSGSSTSGSRSGGTNGVCLI